MNLKTLFAGIALIVLIGIGGFLYRSIKEQPTGPIACTADAKVCPDGTGLGRTGPSCTFLACPPPNVEISSAGIAFALPAGYIADENGYGADPSLLAAFVGPTIDHQVKILVIRQFVLSASTTASQFIHDNARMDPSDLPAPPTAFTATTINGRRFSVVNLGRFEGVVDTAYYLEYGGTVLRFDAISREVENWTDPSLNVLTLPANQDLRALLTTLQGN